MNITHWREDNRPVATTVQENVLCTVIMTDCFSDMHFGIGEE